MTPVAPRRTDFRLRALRRFFNTAACTFVAFTLSSCALFSLGKAPSQTVYLLDLPPSSGEVSSIHSDTVLLVADTAAPQYLRTNSLYTREAPYRIGTYKLAVWGEPAPAQFTSLLGDELARSGRFREVSRASAVQRGDKLVGCEMREFHHLIDPYPGTAVLTVFCTLTDLGDLSLRGSREFQAQVPLETYDAESFVAAGSKAARKVIDEIRAWLVGTSLHS